MSAHDHKAARVQIANRILELADAIVKGNWLPVQVTIALKKFPLELSTAQESELKHSRDRVVRSKIVAFYQSCDEIIKKVGPLKDSQTVPIQLKKLPFWKDGISSLKRAMEDTTAALRDVCKEEIACEQPAEGDAGGAALDRQGAATDAVRAEDGTAHSPVSDDILASILDEPKAREQFRRERRQERRMRALSKGRTRQLENLWTAWHRRWPEITRISPKLGRRPTREEHHMVCAEGLKHWGQAVHACGCRARKAVEHWQPPADLDPEESRHAQLAQYIAVHALDPKISALEIEHYLDQTCTETSAHLLATLYLPSGWLGRIQQEIDLAVRKRRPQVATSLVVPQPATRVDPAAIAPANYDHGAKAPTAKTSQETTSTVDRASAATDSGTCSTDQTAPANTIEPAIPRTRWKNWAIGFDGIKWHLYKQHQGEWRQQNVVKFSKGSQTDLMLGFSAGAGFLPKTVALKLKRPNFSSADVDPIMNLIKPEMTNLRDTIRLMIGVNTKDDPLPYDDIQKGWRAEIQIGYAVQHDGENIGGEPACGSKLTIN